MSVDLPLPDGPMIAVKRPLPNSTLTPRSAATRASPEPYTFQIASARAATGPPAFVAATTVSPPVEFVRVRPSVAAETSSGVPLRG
ncbi:hypothetical protein GCM10010112_29410 [Actinoplanes lobatus]|uniref:Uncharacterized protein n=1 Tax=Actinoplanes lobatus TaxID=113568 RepID=A0ABQ4ANB6_9ACTN|nr:hypothetical protein GCM10010112_29410 [Actinoplanes lobatus]GIE42497.1 hypothetical protein Alo02nite_53950 [Actinoplanes lobatus]